MPFPATRLRRRRQSSALREMLSETCVQPAQLVYPLFMLQGKNRREPIASMPGIYQQTPDNALIEVDQFLKLGGRSVLLFGIPEEKDPEATQASHEYGVVQQAIRRLKQEFGKDLVVIADTCLCEYTSHGHCGMVMDGTVLNDSSIDILARVAVSQAQAGADIVAPSDMMDGRVQQIRWALDEEGLTDTLILSYTAKFASAFYGPFRDAAHSTPTFGDRRTYQMNPANAREALEEVEEDLLEGADMLLVKPATAYLDILYQVRQATLAPVVAYHVSGEYAMLKAAAEKGWIDEKSAVMETLTGIRRAGADWIVTYYALQAAQWLKAPCLS